MSDAEPQSDPRCDAAVVCHRCGALMDATGPRFYVVRIEAFAVPEPPDLTVEDLLRDFRAEIQRLVDEAGELSEQELMDQVYRRLTLHLCPACYAGWIEHPVGDPAADGP